MDKNVKLEPELGIAAVEREVGLSKDVLRVWERRYGFPTPHRDARGERSYPADQVRRLALIKRLMDRGHRPGGLFRTPVEELLVLAGTPQVSATEPREQLGKVLRHVYEHDEVALAEAFQQGLAQVGLRAFVLDTVAPLTLQVGHAWAKGELHVHEEHLFTEVVKRVLRQAISQLPRGKGSVVLLTTLPDEPHGLGLLMVECLLTLHGARCVNLGTQMPMSEIVRAAQAHLADVVAVSFSSAFPARLAAPMVRQLREALTPEIQLWVGGAGAGRLGEIAGVQLLQDLEAAASLLASLP